MKVYKAGCLVLAFSAVLVLAACGTDTSESSVRSAKAHLAKNEDRAAIIELKNALQKEPDSAEARFLLGKALLDSGQSRLAIVELTKAADLRYPADSVLPAMAAALLAEGAARDVVMKYETTTLDDPTANAALKTSVALASLQLGNRAQADRQLTLALASAPGYAPALVARSRLLVAAQDYDAALNMLNQLLATDPAVVDAWKLKGDILQHVKQDADGAVLAYRAALKLKPDSMAAHSSLLSLLYGKPDLVAADAQLEQFKKVFPGIPEAKYYEALKAFHGRDLKTARQIVQQLLTVAPDNPKLQFLAGAVEFESGALLPAENFASRVLKTSPGNLSALRLIGKIHMRTGQPEKALAALLPFVGGSEADQSLVGLVALAYLSTGQIKEAESYFTRALQMNPKDIGSRTALALTRLASGDQESGLGELQSISALDSGTTADLALISALYQRKSYDTALTAIDTFEKKDPKNPLAPMLRGRIQVAQSNPLAARASFERALEVTSPYFPATASLAALDLADKKPEAAQRRFESVLAVDPNNLQALLSIAQLRLMVGGNADEVNGLLAKAIDKNPGEAKPRLLLIDRYLAAKDWKRALSSAQDAVAALPDDVTLLEVLGRAQVGAGEFNQALVSFGKWATLDPKSPEPHLRFAETYNAMKQPDGAVQSLKRALSMSPDLLVAQRGLFSVLLANGRTSEARTYARSLQVKYKEQALGHLFEGEVESTLKNWDAAAAVYRAGLERQKTTGMAVKLHTVLRQGGKQADADKLAASWTREFPKDDVFLFYLADDALTRKDYATAERHYLGFIALRPESPIALNNLAWVTSRLHKPGALAIAERANRLAPNQAELMDTWATLLGEDNQLPKAIELQTRAVKLHPEVPSLRLNLARLLVKSGERQKARTELESLAQLGEKFADQAEVAQLLRLL